MTQTQITYSRTFTCPLFIDLDCRCLLFLHLHLYPQDVLNTFCWIHSTYTIPSAFWKRIGELYHCDADDDDCDSDCAVQVLMLLTPASTRQ